MDTKWTRYVLLSLVFCVGLAVEEEGYRNRRNETFDPDNYKSLYKVSAPPSPDIHVSHYLPLYPTFDTSNVDHPLSESLEIVVSLRNDGISSKNVKAVLAYLANAADPTKFAQTFPTKYVDEALNPKSEISLKHTLRPSVSLVPGTYLLIMRVFYQDANYEYSNMAINKPVSFYLSAGTSFLGILIMLALVGGAMVGAYYFINAVVNKYVYHGNKQQQFDLLDYFKTKFAKQKQ